MSQPIIARPVWLSLHRSQMCSACYLMSTLFDESKTMVTQAFYDYALPLIGDPITDHARLEKKDTP